MTKNIFPVFGGWIQGEDAVDESTVDVINPRASHIGVPRGYKLGQTPPRQTSSSLEAKIGSVGWLGFGGEG